MDFAYLLGYIIGFSLGALIPTFLFSRLFNWVIRKLTKRTDSYFYGNGLSWLLCGYIYSLGNYSPEEGSSFTVIFIIGLISHLLPQFLWLYVDYRRTNLAPKKSRNKI